MSQNEVDITPNADGGVLKKILKIGDGEDTPPINSKVSVYYEGRLTDGSVFDCSRDEPFQFDLGAGMVIKAWDIGVATMKKNEKAIFTCRHDYAYGKTGSAPKIPPSATLIFEVELLDWKPEDLSTDSSGGILRSTKKVGEGSDNPSEGSVVDVHLRGEVDGKIFDDRNVTFPIGEGEEFNICSGLELALKSSLKKQEAILEIKPQYGFGAKGNDNLNVPPNATLKYTYVLNDFESEKGSWQLEPQERLEKAKFLKAKGTDYFQKNKFELALKMYGRMNDFIDSSASEYSDEDQQLKDELKLAMHLNKAICYLKLENFVSARNECDEALQMSPSNEKALFRRSQANLSMAEPEQAKKDLLRLIEIDPKNRTALAQIKKCNQMIQEQTSKEKKIYANMFEKFAKQDQQKERERED